MSEEEYKSYRFNSQTDPSDEMLDHLMGKAAAEVRKSNRAADESLFARLRQTSSQRKAEMKHQNI